MRADMAMMEYAQRPTSFDEIWPLLESCEDAGIRVYDDAKLEMVYRSYAQYCREAGPLAAAMAADGVRAGDKVLICAETTPNFPTLWLALIWLGATPVPMPPRNALMGQYTFIERVRGIISHFRHYYCNPDEVDTLRDLAHAESVDMQVRPLQDLYAAAEHFAEFPLRASIAPVAHAFVQFTSGSTKAPKGILVTYGNLFANVAAIVRRLDARAGDTWISWLPLYHDMGLVGKFLSSMINRLGLVLMSPQAFSRRPLQFLAVAEQYSCTVCSMPNFSYEWIMKRMKSPQSHQLSLRHFRWMGVGAEPIQAATIAEFERVMTPYGLGEGVLAPCYGLAEATLAATLSAPGERYSLSEYEGERKVTCGRAVDGVEIDVSGGSIRLRGDSVACSALVDGRETPLLDADGYYDTRDLGYFDCDRLVVLGRADEMFVINGENYFPYDLENAARDVDGILKNRAICFQTAATDKSPARLVLLYETLPVDEDMATAVEAEIRAGILRHTGLNASVVMGVPARSIPVTPSGKLQRLRARQLFLDGFYEAAAASVRPNALQEQTT
jgi:fatty-acyl-CoA synthase